MTLIVAMAVWNEEELLPKALKSLEGARVDRVHVFDGAWKGGKEGSHTFAGAERPESTDDSRKIALRWPRESGITLHWHPPRDFWPSQEAKRTALFQDIGAREGDYIFVMDADETVDGKFSNLPLVPAHIMVRCVGPNDLPGIRGIWPNGDYCADFKPELRLFPWEPSLDILYPGGYAYGGDLVVPYKDAKGTPALPVLDGITMDHHGNARSAERLEAKKLYYAAEHPERERWQRALDKTASG